MKKILALAVGMLLIPFTAFGMQMMSDSDMDSITGQSGVAISIDNVQIYTDDSGSELWYATSLTGDDSATGDQAAVGLVYGETASTYLFINKVQSPIGLHLGSGGLGSGLGNTGPAGLVGVLNPSANNMLRGNYDPLLALELNDDTDATSGGVYGVRVLPSVLSIRVAQHGSDGVFGNIPAYVAAGFGGDADSAYIEIGLPTLEIFSKTDGEQLQVFVSNATAGIGLTDHQFSLGTITTVEDGATTTILGGRIGITSLGALPSIGTSSTYVDEGGTNN